MRAAAYAGVLAWVATLGLLLAAAPVRGKGADETWYAQRLTSGDAPLRVDNLWSKGPRLRAETVIAGRPILTLVSGERYMIIDRLAGRGISIRRNRASVAADAGRGRPFGNESQLLEGQGAEKIGSEKLGNRACDVYRVTDREGRREICVTSDELRLPLQIGIWVRGVGRGVTVRYLDWTRNHRVPDSFFEPNPRVELEHLEYDDYVKRSRKEIVGPAPPFYAELLHGKRR